ncbi:hypothetical protein [Methylomagnum sp.]
MELTERVANLEKGVTDLRVDIASIKQRLDSELPQLSTKSDIQEINTSLIKWMVGTAIGLGAVAITVITFVLNNAAPKVSATSSQPPIIIQVPGQQITPPANAPNLPPANQPAPSSK